MKKIALVILVGLMFLLVACSNSEDQKSSDSKSDDKSSDKTVTVKNSYEASGEERDGSDAEKVNDTVKVPVNPVSYTHLRAHET